MTPIKMDLVDLWLWGLLVLGIGVIVGFCWAWRIFSKED